MTGSAPDFKSFKNSYPRLTPLTINRSRARVQAT